MHLEFRTAWHGPMQRTVHVLILVACVFFAARGWEKVLRPDGSDFTIYYAAGRLALEGVDPLEAERFLYLPSFAVLMAPLTLLPYGVAAAIWQLGSLAALLWSAKECARLYVPLGEEAPAVLTWLPLLLALRLIDSNMANGQVNAFTLCLCIAALRALRTGRDARAGALIALGAATKILPGSPDCGHDSGDLRSLPGNPDAGTQLGLLRRVAVVVGPGPGALAVAAASRSGVPWTPSPRTARGERGPPGRRRKEV